MNDINETAENSEYQQIVDMGSVTTCSDGGMIHCLTIVGQIAIIDSDVVTVFQKSIPHTATPKILHNI